MIMAEVRDIVDYAYEEELQDTYSSLVDRIESDKFDIISVKCYFKHIPIKDIHLGWSDNDMLLQNNAIGLFMSIARKSII